MTVTVRRPWIILSALAIALLICACGGSTHVHRAADVLGKHNIAAAENDGQYIEAGGITYQLEISRELNPYGVEDSQYVRGLPPGYAQPTAQQLWYGVFLWAKNQHHRAYTTSDNFEIVDTQGNTYYPVKLNPAENPYAWTAQTLAFNTTEPGEDTTGSDGVIGGDLLLFKLDQSVYSNRPLTLYVLGANDQRLGSISLDL